MTPRDFAKLAAEVYARAKEARVRAERELEQALHAESMALEALQQMEREAELWAGAIEGGDV